MIMQIHTNYILPIINQGISDGTIETDYPEQLAELILLAANIWMNPMVFDSLEEESCRKFIVFSQMLDWSRYCRSVWYVLFCRRLWKFSLKYHSKKKLQTAVY